VVETDTMDNDGSARVGMQCRPAGEREPAWKGTYAWFGDVERLPAGGFFPSAVGIPQQTIPEALCDLRWGPKVGVQGYRHGSTEDAVFDEKVRSLYERTHQRRLKVGMYLPTQFARAVLADECRLLVDWCAYAVAKCHSRDRPFETMEEYEARVNTKVDEVEIEGRLRRKKRGRPVRAGSGQVCDHVVEHPTSYQSIQQNRIGVRLNMQNVVPLQKEKGKSGPTEMHRSCGATPYTHDGKVAEDIGVHSDSTPAMSSMLVALICLSWPPSVQ
jgi:hypothetical protein